MVTSSIRRPVSLLVLLSLLVLVFALAACGGDANASSVTVNIKESKAGSGDVYTCDPTSITVKSGDTVTFTNQSDEIQDFDQGDAQKAGVDFKMDLNQSVQVTFKTAGTFTIKSEKGAIITVTVQ